MQKLIALSPEIASAMTKTAAAFGMSGNRYIEEAVVRAIAADAGKVALANTANSDEVARLSRMISNGL